MAAKRGKRPPLPPPPFGGNTLRFETLGLHPQLITVNKHLKLGPGQYDFHSHTCAYKANSSSWKTKQKSEEFSKFLGFKFPCVLAARQFQQTLNGPGNYDLEYPLPHFNPGFGREKRFKTFLKFDQPPPGTYNVKKQRTRFCTTPSFEFDITQRFKNPEPDYTKAPNRYTLPVPSILDKQVSKRGPYDTFTGPRDQTTIKNHFAPPLFTPPDKWYPVPSAMDHLLHHHSKSRCGKFLQGKRFHKKSTVKATKNGFTMFQKDQDYPSPAQYNLPQGIQAAKPNLKPFNCSSLHARPPTNWRIWPGPDRYIIKYPKCGKKATKRSWMFDTKYARSIFKTRASFSF